LTNKLGKAKDSDCGIHKKHVIFLELLATIFGHVVVTELQISVFVGGVFGSGQSLSTIPQTSPVTTLHLIPKRGQTMFPCADGKKQAKMRNDFNGFHGAGWILMEETWTVMLGGFSKSK